jgi:hypothetical protein
VSFLRSRRILPVGTIRLYVADGCAWLFAKAKAASECVRINSVCLRQFLGREGDAIKENFSDTFACVECLRPFVRPSAVRRLVVACGVYSVEGECLRRAAHIAEKLRKVIAPFRTDLNALGPVERVRSVGWVVTPSLGVLPRAVLLSALAVEMPGGVAVAFEPHARHPWSQAPAVCRSTSGQRVSLYSSRGAAVAPALPQPRSIAFDKAPLDDSPRGVGLSGQVDLSGSRSGGFSYKASAGSALTCGEHAAAGDFGSAAVAEAQPASWCNTDGSGLGYQPSETLACQVVDAHEQIVALT